MHFVALNASPRKKGNSEILARLALKEALKRGADSGEVVHLRDFKISQCQGCMRCVFKEEACQLPDDFYTLMEKILGADAFVLTAPTYVTTIPGSLKLVLDRYLLIPRYYEKIYGRPSASIGVASPIDWEHFQLPFLNLFLLGLGFDVEESFIAYGAGPGAVLLDNGQIDRMREAVGTICDLARHPRERIFDDQLSDRCPVCFSTVFERVEGGQYRCPVCLSQAMERDNGFFFPAEGLNNHRWTPARMEDHFQNWIVKTKDMFMNQLKDIRKKRRELLGKGDEL